MGLLCCVKRDIKPYSANLSRSSCMYVYVLSVKVEYMLHYFELFFGHFLSVYESCRERLHWKYSIMFQIGHYHITR